MGRRVTLFFCVFLFVFSWSVYSSDLMLAKVWHDQDVSGWWMSEKLDGVRAYWTGEKLVSKSGQAFHPPEEFIANLPPFAIEGELWGGRNTFHQTVSIVRQQQPHDGWFKLKFAIFDVPETGGSFAQRIQRVEHWFSCHPSPYRFVIAQIPVTSQEQLQIELDRVETAGGEGLIVRDPRAEYNVGRSNQILKIKSFQDAEATVLEILPGRGQLTGRMGALLVRLDNGIKFRLGSGFNLYERENPPAPGTVVTFKYYGFYPSGIPKFPSFLRIRSDSHL